eukprot:s899_g26.t1
MPLKSVAQCLAALCMQKRGAIVCRDLISSSSSSSPICGNLISFLLGVVAVCAVLEMTTTPPHASDQSSDSETYPVSLVHGAYLSFAGTMTVRALLQWTLHLDVDTPDLLRVRNSANDPVPFNTTVRDLAWPRGLTIQIASYTHFEAAKVQFLNLQNVPYVDHQTQLQRDEFTVRLHIHVMSPLRVLEYYERLLSMMSTVISTLERKVARLEQAVAYGVQFHPTPRATSSWTAWDLPPETQIEPIVLPDADPPVEEY